MTKSNHTLTCKAGFPHKRRAIHIRSQRSLNFNDAAAAKCKDDSTRERMRCFCVSHVTQGFLSKLQMASRLQLEKESEEDEFIITLLLLHCLETRKPKRSHQYWLNPLIRKRKKHGVFYHLFKELQLHDAPFPNDIDQGSKNTGS